MSFIERFSLFGVSIIRGCMYCTQLFSQEDWGDVCLAHLFTSVAFDDDRLGVAYVANRNDGDTGGICSPGKSATTAEMRSMS